jgi:Ca-activated chloride channel homolog
VSWQDIQATATRDPSFKWNHPSTSHAAGLLATLAEFYAGAGLTRGLTAEVATDPDVLAYVQAVESTISFYGEGEDVILQRLAEEGRSFLDAFVAQEQTIIHWNQSNQGDRLVAIYPAEGTLWTDHPLALLELGNQDSLAVTDNQRRTYQAFTQYLTGDDAQMSLLAVGYRPANLAIALDQPGSPFNTDDIAGEPAIDWRQPQTTLQIPSPAVVQVVQNVWWYTKRPANIYLVVDTSGSMEGTKLESTRVALRSFVQQIQGDRDRIGLVEFGSGVKQFVALRTMDDAGRQEMLDIVNGLHADGYTALLDAAWEAFSDLQMVADQEAINAIVVMTDGQENDSARTMDDLRRAFERDAQVPMVVFTIAFGDDADVPLLQEMARIGNGQFRRASETDIENLYRVISTYF